MPVKTRSGRRGASSATTVDGRRAPKRARPAAVAAASEGRAGRIESAACRLKTRKDATECAQDLCSALREHRVADIRVLAERLGVPHYACLNKADLCASIDRQIVTYFALGDFLEGAKRLRESIRELKRRSDEVDEAKGMRYARALLDLTLYLLEKYNEMFELATASRNLTHERRNEKLVSTANETIGQANTFISGIGGTFIEPALHHRR